MTLPTQIMRREGGIAGGFYVPKSKKNARVILEIIFTII